MVDNTGKRYIYSFSPLLIHLFIQQIFIEYVPMMILGGWGLSVNENKNSCLRGAYTQTRRDRQNPTNLNVRLEVGGIEQVKNRRVRGIRILRCGGGGGGVAVVVKAAFVNRVVEVGLTEKDRQGWKEVRELIMQASKGSVLRGNNQCRALNIVKIEHDM